MDSRAVVTTDICLSTVEPPKSRQSRLSRQGGVFYISCGVMTMDDRGWILRPQKVATLLMTVSTTALVDRDLSNFTQGGLK